MAESMLMQAYRKMSGGGSMARVGKHVENGVHAVRAGGEGLLTGAGLGFAAAKLPHGLDVPMGTKAAQPAVAATATTPAKAAVPAGPMVKVPVDAAIGVAGLAASVYLANDEAGLGHDARNMGTAGMAVFGYRKANDFAAKKMIAAGQTPGSSITVHGEDDGVMHGFGTEVATDEDPIVAFSSRF